jgi:hypothetical protein
MEAELPNVVLVPFTVLCQYQVIPEGGVPDRVTVVDPVACMKSHSAAYVKLHAGTTASQTVTFNVEITVDRERKVIVPAPPAVHCTVAVFKVPLEVELTIVPLVISQFGVM